MTFFEKIKEFFALAKEVNYDIAQIYSENPDGVYVILLILLIIAVTVYYMINNAVKTTTTIKLISKIQNLKDSDDFSNKLTLIASELPKRGLKLVENLNLHKGDILDKQLSLLANFDIKSKIEKYKQMSNLYLLIANNSKKYNIEDLTFFYEEKSKTLLSHNLILEIENYYKNSDFSEKEIDSVNSIVKYANTISNPFEIINPLQQQINRFSFGHNLDLYKFIKALTKQNSVQIFENCNNKFNLLLTSGNDKISEVILSYMLLNDEKEKVYKYISSLKNSAYLQGLYHNFFGKTQDIDLDLAFVRNDTKIKSEYKEHLDNRITENWKDLSYIKYIIESNGVLKVIGHIDYRNVLERIEKLENEEENNKAASLALEIARRAEKIALEAKAIARSK